VQCSHFFRKLFPLLLGIANPKMYHLNFFYVGHLSIGSVFKVVIKLSAFLLIGWFLFCVFLLCKEGTG
jgi:hypothetical protein